MKKIINTKNENNLINEETLKGNTYEDDEAEIAVEMINVFLTSMGSHITKWLELIWLAIEPLLNSWNDRVRVSAVKITPILVKIMKESALTSQTPNLARTLVARLWKGMDDESDSEVLVEQGKALQRVVEESGQIMEFAELEEFYKKCLSHLQASDKRKQLTETHKDDEEDDEPEIDQIIEEDKDKEDDFHVQVAEIIGA